MAAGCFSTDRCIMYWRSEIAADASEYSHCSVVYLMLLAWSVLIFSFRSVPQRKKWDVQNIFFLFYDLFSTKYTILAARNWKFSKSGEVAHPCSLFCVALTHHTIPSWSRTKYECSDCNVGLCIANCFPSIILWKHINKLEWKAESVDF